MDGPELLSRSCCWSPSSSFDRSIVSTLVSSSLAESNLLPCLQLWTGPSSPAAAPSTSLAAHLCRRETSSSSSSDESELLLDPPNVETVVHPEEEVDAAEGWESNARSEAAALRVDEADVERTMGPSSTWSAIIDRVKQREKVGERGGRRESVVGEARGGLVAAWVGVAERVSEAEEAVERRGDEGSERASKGAKQLLLCYSVFDRDPTTEGYGASQGEERGRGKE